MQQSLDMQHVGAKPHVEGMTNFGSIWLWALYNLQQACAWVCQVGGANIITLLMAQKLVIYGSV